MTATLLDIDAFKQLYQPFSESTLDRLHEFYAANIEFCDPIHRLVGLDELSRYFQGFSQAESPTRFHFTDTLANDSQAFLCWEMHYSHPKLAKGKTLKLEGASHIKFTEKIVFHQDYYDMNAMIYQHLPVIGAITQFVNHKIKSSS